MLSYVGISDFTGFKAVHDLMRTFNDFSRGNTERLFQVGAVMNFYSLHGLKKSGERTPILRENLAMIFSSDEAYNCVHYNDAGSDQNLWVDLRMLIRFGGQRLKAIQLDMAWPDPIEIQKGIVDSGHNLEIILKIDRTALRAVCDSPVIFMDRLKLYHRIVDRVLFDTTTERGLLFDAQDILPFAKAVQDNFPRIGIGVSGGIGCVDNYLLGPLLGNIRNLSVGAEGQFSFEGANGGDLKKAKVFLEKTLTFLAK